MHRPKNFWTEAVKHKNSASIVSLELNLKKVLIYFGITKAVLDESDST